jgi:uncharacterized protein (DUF488 family)
MESDTALLTLGYGKRSIHQVIDLLEEHRVRFLADVRSIPYSRYHPDFSHDALERRLGARGISYLFLGEELGGRPKDPACYDEHGHVVYEACMQRSAFRDGIERLKTAWQRGHRVALLCSEARPENCHRSKLIGVALSREGIEPTHLDEDGTELTQQDVMARLSDGQLGLFDELPSSKAARSRRSVVPSTPPPGDVGGE